jgi:hypothetical protein
MGVAHDHSITLANRVIDKSRRPNRRIKLATGVYYNPSTEKRFDSNGKLIRDTNGRKPSLKGNAANGHVVDIKL